MTCTECGGALDPTTVHTQHTSSCWIDGMYWREGWTCDCPEVCASCCTDPGCALREPQETNDG